MERVYVQIEPGSDSQYYWRDIWQYRGLLLFLAWRDVMVRYKQTTIGILCAGRRTPYPYGRCCYVALAVLCFGLW